MTDSTQRNSDATSDVADSDLPSFGIRVDACRAAAQDTILTPDALTFLAGLHRRFDADRLACIAARRARQARFDARELPDFRADTVAIRAGDWSVAPIPAALQDRRVEITGPVDPKMVINALNSARRCSWPISRIRPHRPGRT